MKFVAILFISIVLMMLMVGCFFPRMEPLPTYTPAPIQQVVVTPTPIPESEWFCLKGKVEVINSTGPYGETTLALVGEQLICGRDWKISGLYGPVGHLDSNPEKILTFKDLQSLLEDRSDNKED